MSYWAKIENNKVVDITVGNENINESYNWLINNIGGKWVQTFQDGSQRKIYAEIGGTYDEARDAFIPLKPYNKWVLNEKTWQWEAPVPYPTDNVMYKWNEDKKDWEAIVNE